ncbi:enoyl-CoA hydratase/isomerase [Chloropicon primus]|nr:enoyl-CoA hydratase/isomerase [Chloropicon primus]
MAASSSSSDDDSSELVLVERRTLLSSPSSSSDQKKVVGLVTLNRPSALNALTFGMIKTIAGAFRSFEDDGDVSCAVLCARGKGFCAGVDLKAASQVFKRRDSYADSYEFDVVHQMERCSFPIVGVVHGAAITAGFEIALACDVLVASEDAFFADTHCKWGIMPGWGLSQKLPRLVGINNARLASLTSCKVSSGKALAWGLVQSVHGTRDLALQEALRICQRVCRNDEGTVRAYKSVLNRGYGCTYEEGRELERRVAWNAYGEMDPDHFKRLARFKSKL